MTQYSKRMLGHTNGGSAGKNPDSCQCIHMGSVRSIQFDRNVTVLTILRIYLDICVVSLILALTVMPAVETTYVGKKDIKDCVNTQCPFNPKYHKP